MPSVVPRRLISEALMRWKLTKLRLIVVEGPSDQRIFRFAQNDTQFGKPLPNVDVLPVDVIEVPASLTSEHGLLGTGAKQRAIAFGREVERSHLHDGFRCIVDRDLDQFLALNWGSASVLYTDHASMEGYFWTISVLRGMALQFQADAVIQTPEKLQQLYESVSECLVELAAVRIVAAIHPEYAIDLHRSTASLSFAADRVGIDINQFVDQCRPAKGTLELVQRDVQEQRTKLRGTPALDVINGHDLVWLLCFAFKHLTTGPKRLVEEEIISNSLFAFGLQTVPVVQQPLLQQVSAWADT